MNKFSTENFDIKNITKSALPRALFVSIYKKILGSKYELSISFIKEKEMKDLSIQWKGNDKHMNILSFPLSKNSGEIFICPEIAKKECVNFNQTYKEYVKFLVIHGMLHLAGYVHGSKMEAEEKKMMKEFSGK